MSAFLPVPPSLLSLALLLCVFLGSCECVLWPPDPAPNDGDTGSDPSIPSCRAAGGSYAVHDPEEGISPVEAVVVSHPSEVILMSTPPPSGVTCDLHSRDIVTFTAQPLWSEDSGQAMVSLLGSQDFPLAVGGKVITLNWRCNSPGAVRLWGRHGTTSPVEGSRFGDMLVLSRVVLCEPTLASAVDVPGENGRAYELLRYHYLLSGVGVGRSPQPELPLQADPLEFGPQSTVAFPSQGLWAQLDRLLFHSMATVLEHAIGYESAAPSICHANPVEVHVLYHTPTAISWRYLPRRHALIGPAIPPNLVFEQGVGVAISSVCGRHGRGPGGGERGGRQCLVDVGMAWAAMKAAALEAGAKLQVCSVNVSQVSAVVGLTSPSDSSIEVGEALLWLSRGGRDFNYVSSCSTLLQRRPSMKELPTAQDPDVGWGRWGLPPSWMLVRSTMASDPPLASSPLAAQVIAHNLGSLDAIRPSGTSDELRSRRSANSFKDEVGIGIPGGLQVAQFRRLMASIGPTLAKGTISVYPAVGISWIVHHSSSILAGHYFQVLDEQALPSLKSSMSSSFEWARVTLEGAISSPPLFFLAREDLAEAAAVACCDSSVAGSGLAVAFPIVRWGENLELVPDLYRLSHYLSGQLSYQLQLAASQIGMGSASIGCFGEGLLQALLGLPRLESFSSPPEFVPLTGVAFGTPNPVWSPSVNGVTHVPTKCE